MLRKNIYAIAMGLVGAVLPLASIRAQETKSSGETETPIRVQVPVTAPEGKISYDEEVLVVTDDTPPLGEYWIGIALGELPEVVKQQLQIENGLVVEDVLPDSPAAKAEFKKFDVLLKAADKPPKKRAKPRRRSANGLISRGDRLQSRWH
jgi:S1-C subfamily serine protease